MPATAPTRAPGQVRIIAGRWRRRLVRIPRQTQTRPTPGRARETLFNWLQPGLADAVCLDLFAGSGALGLEALSRGAARVVAVDRNAAAIRALRQTCAALRVNAGGLTLHRADALHFLRTNGESFDIVFLDPPYGGALRETLCATLAASGCVKPGARIYLESAAHAAPEAIPPHWQLLRRANCGGARLALYRDNRDRT
ncbi:MAG: 16S rRNA (guanine(966)-N(2))-methyltransferase RsmD [Gammaproteobacteria bacterium]|nr:16S rRNA (guanine(966)-N(2))-methyltransferase RsmD [Gammaproteobacteria bacterium]MDD9870394.1 16S rRNA (guanine(966)-N(2))-methyltransferase RsmD [Gammaproteobacteria bacterium]